jgi:antitoxin (DNA-binding transcriptional repressor) of toxin-antitoxin stability system
MKVSVTEAKAQLTQLVRRAEAGGEVRSLGVVPNRLESVRKLIPPCQDS